MTRQRDNRVMLITYADSLGADLKELKTALDTWYDKAVGGVHILPFFPSGADRGFSPKTYESVDPVFGSFADVEAIGKDRWLMFDFMVNHISAQSAYYQDFLARKDESDWKDFFIRYSKFWPGGAPTPEQVEAIYKRKPRAPYIEARFADGTEDKVWCTFSEDQIDLDVSSPAVRAFIDHTLDGMADHGASVIRLDAFAYAVKKPGGSCFFEAPEIWELLEGIESRMAARGVEILPEIHEHYTIPLSLARRGYWIYDFALPVLTLHALYTGNGTWLANWLKMSPKHQYTTLDTHDGLGIVDVRDLLPQEETDRVLDLLYEKGANLNRKYSSEEYGNLDIYQVNTTYYSALGNDDARYLMARAIQFFAPGIPQVYYVGLLAGENDLELLEKTRNGRDINRHGYSLKEIEENQKRPVVQNLKALMELRNTHPAFDLEGDLDVTAADGHLCMIRRAGQEALMLDCDLDGGSFVIEDLKRGERLWPLK
ncbi:sucrose phosphorylase [uncultured Faecalibaculum sp.]|uniref:sucrose phosphorylase n=1 Tax=uncultured Faecalibaculum sp. TaxID=1729681 RepID=UPI0026180296|nr:sucrose phosphorylase [uncultured Faecalibaculum sp.]